MSRILSLRLIHAMHALTSTGGILWIQFFGELQRNRDGRAKELLSPGCMNVNENPLLTLPPRLLSLKFWRRYRTSTPKDIIKTSL